MGSGGPIAGAFKMEVPAAESTAESRTGQAVRTAPAAFVKSHRVVKLDTG